MKEINRANYEAYFIDYLEGNLDETMIDSFIAFSKREPRSETRAGALRTDCIRA